MTDHTLQPAPGDEFDQSVKACAWWVPTFAEPLVGRGDKRPMLYPDAKPLYDQAALDAAVAAERERCSVVTNAMVLAANAAMFGRLVQGDARFETLRIGLEAAMAARTEAQG
jgi:hypothetical protein